MNASPTERFSSRVENYVKYRPHYPAEIISALQEHTGLLPRHIIADVGSARVRAFIHGVGAIERNSRIHSGWTTPDWRADFSLHQMFRTIREPAESVRSARSLR